MKSKRLRVSVNDTIKVSDGLGTTKNWFGEIRRFFTVKTLPPRR